MKSIAAPFRKGAPTFLWFLLPVLALLLAFLGLSAFHTNQNPMQNLHNGDYEAEWRLIDSLEREGLPKSALEKVLALYERAKTDRIPAQIVKCLIYRSKFESQLEEDGLVKAIGRWEAEIDSAALPEKAVLQSLLAELYATYLNNHRWQFEGRTHTPDWKPDDIRTWSVEHLLDRVAELYWASLEHPGLQTVRLDDFDAILLEGRHHEGLRPTLYDFLAHRALSYFMNAQAHLTQPAYQFYIDRAAYFAPAPVFAELNIQTRDSSSHLYRSLLLFQDLLEFRLGEPNLPALVDVDLLRLQFVYQNAVLSDKFERYTEALERLAEGVTKDPVHAEVLFQLADAWYARGRDYKPNPADIGRWDWKTALEIARRGAERFPESFGGERCQALVNRILQKNMKLETEAVNPSGGAIPARLSYRNIEGVWFRVVRLNAERLEQFEKLSKDKDDGWRKAGAFLRSLPPLQQFQHELPPEEDYREHATEVKIEALEPGDYALLAADNPDFEFQGGAVHYVFFQVSNLAYWHRVNARGRNQFIVFDRRTGVPREGVTVEFWKRDYNPVTRRYVTSLAGRDETDADGIAYGPGSGRRGYGVLLRHERDTLDESGNFYPQRRAGKPKPWRTTHFFLDRAIYRPGQTIHFKALVLEFDENRMPSVVADEPVTITFRDANYQEVEKLELRTNEYGTVSGTFTAPRGGLLGQMSLISSMRGYKPFRVEEYKRPRFEVVFEPLQGSFRLDEEVRVTGRAEAYAGSNVDGATVRWRVVREVRFPWLPWWYWRGRPNPWSGESQEIANGTAATDAQGRFEVRFTALPDRSIPPEQKPEFRYTVYADVIDITGETHSAETVVRVGTVALNAAIELPRKMLLDSFQRIPIRTTNLNGEPEGARGTFTLTLLQTPDRPFVERLWERPDRQVLSEGEFRKAFPHWAYRDEDQPWTWPARKVLMETPFDSDKARKLLPPRKKLVPGVYKLSLKTQDAFGTPVEVEHILELFRPEGALPAPAVLSFHYPSTPQEPETEVPVLLGSSEREQPVLFEVERQGKIVKRKWLKLNGWRQELLKVRESDRGNFHFHLAWARHNRAHTRSQTIRVPWSNKELQIEYGTFRDKLKPGQEEEWVLKIKGPKGEAVAAELVAAMYDASLDAFAPNRWNLNLYPTWGSARGLRTYGFTTQRSRYFTYDWNPPTGMPSRRYPRLNWFGFQVNERYYRHLALEFEDQSIQESMALEEVAAPRSAPARKESALAYSADAVEVQQDNTTAGMAAEPPAPPETQAPPPPPPVRTNLDETVFFFPRLMTDADGNVVIRFTMNEALTRWNFLTLAHTTDLKVGTSLREVVTQKELMVLPNPPRFFREGDEIEFTAKVVNLSERTLSGNAELQLVNPLKTVPVYKWLDNPQFNQHFRVKPGQSARVAWRFRVPEVSEVPLIEHTVLAVAGDFSDAERSVAPVLSNRMLVTESMPLPIGGKEEKTFTFERLRDAHSPTLRHHALTLEFTSNPAWYAVQALPYLMEFPHECSEQLFNRFYANALAGSVANAHPKIRAVFEKWRDYQPDALLSNLSKNEELKSALLEETPWVLNAQSEEQQKRNIALLFDLNRMSYELENALAKLQERQLPGGGFAWFPGGRDNWYITQYIVEGMGHLDRLGVRRITDDDATWSMVRDAVRYCDERIVEHYETLERRVEEGHTSWDKDHLDPIAIHYLYARSFFLEDLSAQAATGTEKPGRSAKYLPLEGKARTVFDYYLGQAEKFWLGKGIYQEGMLSLALHRLARGATVEKMIASFKERALQDEERGMYWKYPSGWWWWQMPIETHALMIEVFEEAARDPDAVHRLKVWLLKNKQTTHWKTTKATAGAVYALLMSGENWLLEDEPLQIRTAPDLQAQLDRAQKQAEAGTGYFKVRFEGEDLSPEAATLTVRNPNEHPAWGALYWQYFEDLDRISTFEETPLQLKKQLFRVELGPTGEVMRPVLPDTPLKPGDKLRVRIELRADRDMEYVHMKDMRASGFEPLNVFSRYKWQDGLGYYESTRDAATHFFISYLPRGTYVFEYPLRVVHQGEFSNGVTTIQCMYAPEFTSHSEGVRVRVGE